MVLSEFGPQPDIRQPFQITVGLHRPRGHSPLKQNVNQRKWIHYVKEGRADERSWLIDVKWIFVGVHQSHLHRETKRMSRGMWVIKVKRWDLLRRRKMTADKMNRHSPAVEPWYDWIENTKRNNYLKNINSDDFRFILCLLDIWRRTCGQVKKKRKDEVQLFFACWSVLGYNRKQQMRSTQRSILFLSVTSFTPPTFSLVFNWSHYFISAAPELHQQTESKDITLTTSKQKIDVQKLSN